MRTTPLVGKKVWFGPRRFGWGLSPVSVEGWVATFIATALSFWIRRRWPERALVRQAPMIVLVVVAVVKGTAPGGRQSRLALTASDRAEPQG